MSFLLLKGNKRKPVLHHSLPFSFTSRRRDEFFLKNLSKSQELQKPISYILCLVMLVMLCQSIIKILIIWFNWYTPMERKIKEASSSSWFLAISLAYTPIVIIMTKNTTLIMPLYKFSHLESNIATALTSRVYIFQVMRYFQTFSEDSNTLLKSIF